MSWPFKISEKYQPGGVGVRVAVAVVAELVLGVVLEGVNAGRGVDGSFRGGDGGLLGVQLVFLNFGFDSILAMLLHLIL